DGKEADALGVQPRALFAGREIDIGFRPLSRPMVFGAVEGGGAKPVLQRELARVMDAKAALLRRVDEHQSAERPEGLAAKRSRRFLVDEDHAALSVGELRGCHEPGEPRAYDDDVSVHAAPFTLAPGILLTGPLPESKNSFVGAILGAA